MRYVFLFLCLLVILLSGCTIIDEKNNLVEEKTEQFRNTPLERTLEKQESTSTSPEKIQPCTIEKTVPKFTHESYYTGQLIDTHVHMPVSSKIVSAVAIQSGFEDMPAYDNKLSPHYLTCLFRSEGIAQTFGFHIIPNMVIGQSIQTIQDMKEKYPEQYVHFYMPTQLGSLNPSTEKIDELLTEHDFFRGYGEVKFDFSEIENEGIESEKYLEAYALAEKHNLLIMMHPGPEHEAAVKRLLEQHPTTNFLFHSGEIEHWIFSILEEYENVHYSLDANLVPIYGWEEQHSEKSTTKEEFLAYMEEHFEKLLTERVNHWKPLIEKHPNKFTWGSDRWYRHHFDVEVGKMVEEFSRAFIGQLDPKVQEQLAYKNAQRLIRR